MATLLKVTPGYFCYYFMCLTLLMVHTEVYTCIVYVVETRLPEPLLTKLSTIGMTIPSMHAQKGNGEL